MANTFGSGPTGAAKYDPATGQTKDQAGQLWRVEANGSWTPVAFNPANGTYDPSGPTVAMQSNGAWGNTDPNAKLYQDPNFGGQAPGGPTISSKPSNPFEGLAPTTDGLQPGTPIPGAEGLDFLKQGPAEQQWDDTKGAFTGPSRAGTRADEIAQTFGVSGPSVNTGNAQSAFDDFLKTTPADMSSYYANAARVGQENIDKTMAARGLYGSSAAADMTGEMNTNLAADRAKAEAGYGLQRAGLEGSLGSGADTSNIAGSANQRAWTSGLEGLLAQGDTEDLAKATAGMNAAATAQGAQRTRGQDMFQDAYTMGTGESGIMGQGYNTMNQNDLDLLQQQIALELGIPTEALNQAKTTQQTDTNQGNQDSASLLALLKLLQQK
jgi:hypothetical protein